MDGRIWLEQMKNHYEQYKSYSERAAEQVSNEKFFSLLGDSPLSIAILIKHVGGNHYSRWRDFLTTDGEKSDRNRDMEFIWQGETRQIIYEQWEKGWHVAFETLGSLSESDLDKTITIRGESLTVIEAIQRNLNHVIYHTGQIVHLARQFVGENWQTLSIAVGKSEEHNSKMKTKYGDWQIKEDK